MPDPEERELIVEHALIDDENLRIAIKLGESYEAIRARVISRFLAKAAEGLRQRLGSGWSVTEAQEASALSKGDKLSVSKDTWLPKLSVVLKADFAAPRDLFFAVRGDLNGQTTVTRERIKLAVDTGFGIGKQDGSHWWKYLTGCYRYWHTEECLLKLWNGDEALPYVIGSLTAIAEYVDSLMPQ